MRVTQLMIIEAIKESGEKGMSMVEIRTKFSMRSTPKSTMNAILSAENSPVYREKETNTSSGKGIQYRYYFRTPVIETKPNEENKNAEGYSYPTAAKAIKNLERTNGFMPGGIYEFRTRPGSFFLIIDASNSECALGYVVGKTADNETDASTVCWQAGKHYDLVRTNQLTYAKYGWLNKLFDRRCPFQPLKDILAKSPLRNMSVIKIADDEAIEKAKEEVRSEISKRIGVAETENRILHTVMEDCDKLKKDNRALKTASDIFEHALNQIAEAIGNETWSPDVLVDDIIDLVGELEELRLKDQSRPTINVTTDTKDLLVELRVKAAEANIWKYAFDKVTGGTISENLD